MLLAKSCQKKYNIKNGTIKLGTLYEYRSIENDELIDKQEGMLTFNLNFRGNVEVPPEWFATISGGGMATGRIAPLRFPGRQSSHFIKVEFAEISEHRVVLRDSSAVFSHESLNSFIFCVSRVRRTTDCVGIFTGCDDYWYIPEARARAFADRLGKTLLNHIIEGHNSGNPIIPQDIDVNSLEIAIEHRQVDYISRDINLYDNGALTLESFTQKMRNMAFTKPESYKAELEYRFNFIIISNGRIIEPLVKSVYLNSKELLELVI
ncbi:hypothetical protein [Pseudomonas asiatica]|uniref:hypothetical protein n=1 Tax=Pseudomonas asiatica TaxID=2219225 RepID=UPI00236652E4|nr:hypothetical protein [Pseudomonas asiatica]MDD1980016.1 hypothetical protein [Pseudomonas asiatica]